MKETIFWQSRSAQRTSFYAVASCGLLPRTTRPGPRLWTAYPAVAILPLRDTGRTRTWSPVDLARIPLSTASRKFRGRRRLNVILRWRRIRDPSARGDELPAPRLPSQGHFPEPDPGARGWRPP